MLMPFIAGLFGFIFWVSVFRDWRRGLWLLLVYMPFAGLVSLSLYPSPIPLLFKDFFFVIPLYLVFFVFGGMRHTEFRVPALLSVLMALLTIIVLLQMFNPALPNFLVAAIGAKVWLLYLPLVYVGAAYLRDRQDLWSTLRMLVAIAWIPCVLGILEWIGCMTFGYQATMQAIYREASEGATQNFAFFDLGGTFYRIPSTFTFVAGYFGYALSMIVPAYFLMKGDPDPRWQRFGLISFGFITLATFLSGARGAFLFVPLLLALIYLLEGRVGGMIKMVVFLPLTVFAALGIAGINFFSMFDLIVELVTHYSQEIAYQGIVNGIQSSPFGQGTGMNTGPARHAFEDPDLFQAFENYYAKAVLELGIAGLAVVVGLFLSMIGLGFKAMRSLQDQGLRSGAAAMLAFIITMVLNSFKGWQIDIDPINVYLWLFTGFLLRLPALEATSAQPVTQPAVPHPGAPAYVPPSGV